MFLMLSLSLSFVIVIAICDCPHRCFFLHHSIVAIVVLPAFSFLDHCCHICPLSPPLPSLSFCHCCCHHCHLHSIIVIAASTSLLIHASLFDGASDTLAIEQCCFARVAWLIAAFLFYDSFHSIWNEKFGYTRKWVALVLWAFLALPLSCSR